MIWWWNRPSIVYPRESPRRYRIAHFSSGVKIPVAQLIQRLHVYPARR